MKKIFMTTMLFLASLASYGNEVSNEKTNENIDILMKEQTFEMYDFKDFNVLNSLELTDAQREDVFHIMNLFNKQMKNSFNSENRKEKTLKTLNRNVYKMRDALTRKQYRMYLRMLNLELNKRGVDII